MKQIRTLAPPWRRRWAINFATLALLLGFALGSASGQRLEIHQHAVLPGGTVPVPVWLSNVPGVASVSIQINFDPQLLTLIAVTQGALGSTFALAYNSGEGNVRIAAVRPNALTNASGVLVILQFQANSGAQPPASSAVALANYTLSGAFGQNLEGARAVAPTNGSVTVVSLLQDSDGNGLPDWWEETYFGARTGSDPAADSDGDGMTNRQEYLAGTNPRDSGSVLRVRAAAVGGTGFKISFPTVAGKSYRVLRSDHLNSWAALGGDWAGTGATVEVIDADGPNGAARYYRIMVVR